MKTNKENKHFQLEDSENYRRGDLGLSVFSTSVLSMYIYILKKELIQIYSTSTKRKDSMSKS